MKNIVFDLGGVVFHRDPEKVSSELIEFFSFVAASKMPRFWVEYDRGTLTYDEVLDELSREKNCFDFLRKTEIYRAFDGEVVSCEERVVKPEDRIYEILLQRYGLKPEETLFIDDRRGNLEAAARFGIATFHFGEPAQSCERLRRLLLSAPQTE